MMPQIVAFAPASVIRPACYRGAPLVQTGSFGPFRARALSRSRVPRMVTPSSGGASPPQRKGIDELLAMFSHKNKNQRMMAATELASMDPPDQVIARLLALLDKEDTDIRRTAVQALGMIGEPAILPLVDVLTSSDNSTVRASCSKGLAALVMYSPQLRASFPDAVLDSLKGAVVNAEDPVTKLATVGCLTTLACDAQFMAEVDDIQDPVEAASPAKSVISVAGNDRAFEMLVELLNMADDVVTCGTVAGSLAQVANCGTPERKAYVLDCLQAVADKPANPDDKESGYSYVQEMCRSHVSQLRGLRV